MGLWPAGYRPAASPIGAPSVTQAKFAIKYCAEMTYNKQLVEIRIDPYIEIGASRSGSEMSATVASQGFAGPRQVR